MQEGTAGEAQAPSRAGTSGGPWGRWVPLLVLVLVPLLFYGSMVFRGLEPAAPDTGASRPFGVWGDEAVHTTGRTPVWYPYIFSGMPSYGSLIYTPRSPVDPIAIVQKAVRDNRGIYYVFLLIVGGWAGYAFLRRQGRSRLASTTASLVFTMTPYFAGSVAAGHSTKFEALCLLPLFLLAIDVFLAGPDLLRTAFLAGAGALLAWANHPQVAFYGLLIGVLYALGVLLIERGGRIGRPGPIRLALLLVLAVVLALCMVAEPYLAVHEYAPYSIRGGAATEAGAGAPSATGVGWQYATAWSFHPKELISFLFPGWFGLQGQTYWGPMPFTQSTHYFGIAALALALFGLFRLAGRRRWIWGGISAIVLFIGFGRYVPILYGPMYHLVPYFNRFRVPSMIYATLPFCLGYLVAGGMDTLLGAARSWEARPEAGPGSPARTARTSHKARAEARRQGGASQAAVNPGDAAARRLALLLAALVACWILVAVGARAALSGSEALLRPSEAGSLPAASAAALQSTRMGILERSVAQGFSVLVIATALLLLVASRVWPRRRIVPWLGVALSVVLVGDIFAVGRRFYHVEPRPSVQESIPLRGACEFLKAQPGPFRILPAAGEIFSSNSFGLEHLQSIGGYHPAKLRVYQDLLDGNLITRRSVLRMLNVHYLLSPAPIDLGVSPVFREDGYVYPLPDSLPRVWPVEKLETVAGEDGVLRRIGDEGFDPGREAVTSSTAPHPEAPRFAPARISALDWGDGRLGFRTDSDSAAFVVVSEISYPPGWIATIDGTPVPIYRVDHVLMGCEVPAGTHEVRLRARSPGLRVGRSVSHIASGLVALLAVAGALQGLGGGRREGRGAAS